MEDELELAGRCRQGDTSALRQVYTLYAGSLLAVCLRYAGNRMDAEDILQEVFLKAFRSFDRFNFQGKGSLKAWLLRIAVNESLEFLRKRKTELLNTMDVEDMKKDIPDEDEDGDDDTLASRLADIPREKLMTFIEALPAGYRAVFNLYVFEGKSHREIGELLGITERTSSSQFSRARRLLRTKIMEYLEHRSI